MRPTALCDDGWVIVDVERLSPRNITIEEAEETGLALMRDDLAVLYLSDDEAMTDVAMCTQSGLDFSMCYGLYGED